MKSDNLTKLPFNQLLRLASIPSTRILELGAYQKNKSAVPVRVLIVRRSATKAAYDAYFENNDISSIMSI